MLSITVRGVVVSVTDYIGVNQRIIAVSPGTKSLRLLVIVTFALCVICIGLDWQLHRGFSFSGNLLPLTMIALNAYLLFGSGWLRWRLAASYEKNSPALHHPADYTFTADKIRGHSELHDFTSAFSTIKRADAVYPWLLLYLSEKSCFWLDLRQVEAPATTADLYQLLAEHQVAPRDLGSL